MKTIDNKPLELDVQVQELLKQLKVKKQQEEVKRQLEAKYYAINSEGKNYESILKKLRLLDNYNRIKPLIKAQVSCPASFCFQIQKDEIKKSFIEQTNDTIFYNLVITSSGKTLLEIFRNDVRVEEMAEYNNYNFLLNLPYLLGKILEDKKLKQVRENLENFLKENPASTLANLYSFAKKNLLLTKEIPTLLQTFKDKLEENYKFRTEVYGYTKAIPKTFLVKIRNYGSKTKMTKYTLEEDISEPTFTTQLNYQNYYYYPDYSYKTVKYRKIGFPMKILVKEGRAVPLYMPDSSSGAKESEFNKEELHLLTFEEKLKEEVAVYIAARNGNAEEAEIYFKEEMTKELKSINRALKKFLKENKGAELNIVQNEKIEAFKLSEENLQKSTEKLTKILAQLYKKEIILNNL